MDRELKSKIIGLRCQYKYIVYLICTVGICWIGVWRDIGTGAQWAFASNCVGFCLFPMILCRFKARDFIKLPYAVWILVFSAAAVPMCEGLLPGTDYDAQIISAILNVGLYGIIAIRLFYFVFLEKCFYRNNFSILFFLWLIMMLLCFLSRNEAIWPLWYLVMFGAFYVAPTSKMDLRKMLNGVVDGIIVSFFWVQIRAFLYRPYDTGAYYGHFTNNIVNGMFYALSLSALLTRLWMVSRKECMNGKCKKASTLVFYILSISVLDFTLFTGSRAALLTVLGMLGIYLIIDVALFSKKKFRDLFIKGCAIVIVFLILLYPVYACMRYIPALRHHPIWYSDYSEEKVHSYDPIDSDKYTTFEQALDASGVSRVYHMFYTGDYGDICGNTVSCISRIGFWGIRSGIITFPVLTPVKYQAYPGGVWVYEYDDGIEPGADVSHRAFIDVDLTQVKDMRLYIWKYFIERLNIWGHEELYVGVYISDYYGHAHNSFLQMAYLFGTPVGILFLVIVVGGIIKSFNAMLKKADRDLYFFPLVFLLGYLLFGTFDCLVLTGEALFTIFFLCLDLIIKKVGIVAD